MALVVKERQTRRSCRCGLYRVDVGKLTAGFVIVNTGG
jgi:hypothetical protein